MAIENSEYRQWISTIERRFRQQQIKAAVQVNSSKIEFYWSLGRDICEMHVEERWGESVIKQLSEDLRHVIGEAKGLTPGNLYYCKRFYLLYSQLFEKVPQVEEKSPSSCGCGLEISPLQIVPQVGEIFKPLHTITENQMLPLNIFAIPWGHHKAILDRCENEPMKALFYAAKTYIDKPTIGLLICRSKNNVFAQYCLEGYNQPIAITAYEGVWILPDNFNETLPSIEDLEAELSK